MTTFEAKDPLVGQRIDGRYLVKGVLGRGGMGVVYDGTHEQLGRSVAIKVLGPGVAGDQIAVDRFLREARTASGLTHGNIVDVSDLGQLPDGRPYLVMPKMHGEDLCTLLYRVGPQAPNRVVELLRGVAAGLDLIHAKGFVHRDIKLENLMHVVREDGSETVMVLDFGIVGLVAGNAKRLTAEGSVFGTPVYLPPEVIQGETMDRRGDVYALATCAFELMTGFAPFDAENPIKILPMKVNQDAPSMSAVSGREFPQQLEAVIARNLARNPEARHDSAGAFVAALDEAVRASAAYLGTKDFADIPKRDSMQQALLRRLPSASSLAVPSGDGSGSSPVASGPPVPRAGHSGVITAERFVTSKLAVPRRGAPIMLLAAGGVGLAIAVWGLTSGSDAPSARSVTSSPLPKVAEASSMNRAAPLSASAQPSSAVPGTAAQLPSAGAAAPEPVATGTGEPTVSVTPLVAASAPTAKTTKKSSAWMTRPEAQKPMPPTTASPAVSIQQSAADLNRSAMQAMLQGRLQDASSLYSRATQADPRNAAAFRGLGLTSEKLGRKPEAIAAFKRALALVPEGREAESLRERLQKLGATP